MARQLGTRVGGQRVQVGLVANVRHRELAVSTLPRLDPDLGQLVATGIWKPAEHLRQRVREQRGEHEDVRGSAGWPPDAAAVLRKGMVARLQDHVVAGVVGCARDAVSSFRSSALPRPISTEPSRMIR